MENFQDLLDFADKLDACITLTESPAFRQPINALMDAVEQAERAWSGSWLGYHANVYYSGLAPAPPGAHFSQEWGLQELFSGMGSKGHWVEVSPDAVERWIIGRSNDANMDVPKDIISRLQRLLKDAKSESQVIIESFLRDNQDKFAERLRDELDNVNVVDSDRIISIMRPKGQIITRDALAVGQGYWVPPHIRFSAPIVAMRHTIDQCKVAAEALRKIGSYLQRRQMQARRADRTGTNVFIGHGRSSAWRELKDFVKDRLSLPYDEFNRVPVAGFTNIARLSEMLDAAAIAFLIMTAEDEMADGAMQARMNVIHEVGLFQGRLGFSRAILLLEEGCSEFSNVQGLGQIRFPRGNISAAFEAVRQVLEREKLIAE
ncbi:hypothetical protein ASE63_05365 [Bosea sp. Root381]|uniref:TIR domain-containing protein n=1 Tax=Bosea sp. Root381 TaxID=1736524 RepID=UPI0006FA23D3|nr:TIR domain-containing protein [Bosea sp. Root381]KRE09997.1 hypothetical protein ASE63_05365 [Bosea sp. Root381]